MKAGFILLVAALSVGCASPTPILNESYAGDTAIIDDSFQIQSITKANLFYLQQVDEKPVPNALTATANASSGRGSQVIPRGASRRVPVRSLNVYLVGETYYSAPISRLIKAGSIRNVEGLLRFTPEPNNRYVVSGVLSEARSAVWIEDINGNIVSEIIEKTASSDEGGKISITTSPIQKTEVLSEEELFLKITSGESVGLVEKKLGPPDNISVYGGNHFSGRQPSVTYSYDALGTVEFSAKGSTPLFVQKVTPMVQDVDTSSIKMQLKTSGPTLQSLAKNYYQQDHLPTEVLDLLAEKIWQERNTEEAYTADAIAWLCKVLGKSNNPRYRTFLERVANETTSKKISKHAKSNFELLPDNDTVQYVPDT